MSPLTNSDHQGKGTPGQSRRLTASVLRVGGRIDASDLKEHEGWDWRFHRELAFWHEKWIQLPALTGKDGRCLGCDRRRTSCNDSGFGLPDSGIDSVSLLIVKSWQMSSALLYFSTSNPWTTSPPSTPTSFLNYRYHGLVYGRTRGDCHWRYGKCDAQDTHV